MKKTIECHNTQTAIKSRKSSEIFKKILLNLNIDEDEIKILLDIFNKIKNGQGINLEEEIKIINIISKGDFVLKLIDILEEYEIEAKKEKDFSVENILITIIKYINNSSIIDILDNRNSLSLVETNEKGYIKVFSNGGKSYYLETISGKNGFLYCEDIKSEKKKVVDINSKDIVFETKGDFKLNEIQYLDEAIFLKNLGPGDDYMITSNFTIGFNKQSNIHLSQYDLFISDPISRKIHRVDKKTLKLSEIDLYQYNILDIQKGNLLLLSPSINIGNSKNKTFSQSYLSLFNTDANEEIIKNIHLKYYKMTKTIFIGLSYDEEILYKYDFKTKKIDTIYLENIEQSGDELWEEIQKTHKI